MTLLRRTCACFAAARSASASTAPASSASAVPHAQRSPFHPWKNPASGRWRPPQFSLRRQAQLAQASYELGTLSLLPKGPKVTRLRARLLDAQARAKMEAQTQAEDTDALEAAFRAWNLKPREEQEAAKAIARGLRHRGPYAGRKNKMFKGTMAQRQRAGRQRDIQDRLEAMPRTIAEWKNTKAAAKAKSKPAMPF